MVEANLLKKMRFIVMDYSYNLNIFRDYKFESVFMGSFPSLCKHEKERETFKLKALSIMYHHVIHTEEQDHHTPERKY